jgi:hypothetical protein
MEGEAWNIAMAGGINVREHITDYVLLISPENEWGWMVEMQCRLGRKGRKGATLSVFQGQDGMGWGFSSAPSTSQRACRLFILSRDGKRGVSQITSIPCHEAFPASSDPEKYFYVLGIAVPEHC